MSLICKCQNCFEESVFRESQGSASCSNCGYFLEDYVQIDFGAEFRNFEDGADLEHYGGSFSNLDGPKDLSTKVGFAAEGGNEATSALGKKLRRFQRMANHSYKEERDKEQSGLLSELCDQMGLGFGCDSWAEELYHEIVTEHRERFHKSSALLVACLWEASFLSGLNSENSASGSTLSEDYFLTFISDDKKNGRKGKALKRLWREKLALVRDAEKTLLVRLGKTKIEELCSRLGLGSEKFVECVGMAHSVFEEVCSHYTNPRDVHSSSLRTACVYVAGFLCGANGVVVVTGDHHHDGDKGCTSQGPQLKIPTEFHFRFVEDESQVGLTQEQMFANWLRKVGEVEQAWARALARRRAHEEQLSTAAGSAATKKECKRKRDEESSSSPVLDEPPFKQLVV